MAAADSSFLRANIGPKDYGRRSTRCLSMKNEEYVDSHPSFRATNAASKLRVAIAGFFVFVIEGNGTKEMHERKERKYV